MWSLSSKKGLSGWANKKNNFFFFFPIKTEFRFRFETDRIRKKSGSRSDPTKKTPDPTQNTWIRIRSPG